MRNNRRARQAGTTLLELSVVIAVILLLVGVTFIGINAWREGANKSACILNLSTIQKAMRGYQNMNNLQVGDALVSTSITGTGNLLEVAPSCPTAKAAYNYLATVPATGTPYGSCPNSTPHTVPAGQLSTW